MVGRQRSFGNVQSTVLSRMLPLSHHPPPPPTTQLLVKRRKGEGYGHQLLHVVNLLPTLAFPSVNLYRVRLLQFTSTNKIVVYFFLVSSTVKKNSRVFVINGRSDWRICTTASAEYICKHKKSLVGNCSFFFLRGYFYFTYPPKKSK